MEPGVGEEQVKDLIPLYENTASPSPLPNISTAMNAPGLILQMRRGRNQKKGAFNIRQRRGGVELEQAAPQRAWFSIHVQRGPSLLLCHGS
jgi:hypothetical protein